MGVKPVTSLGRSGLSDWLIQRVSAVVIAIYVLVMVGYLVAHPDLVYLEWAALHQQFWVRLLTLATVLAIAAHAWIGVWAVLTDYVTVRLMGPAATVLPAPRPCGRCFLCPPSISGKGTGIKG